MATGSWAKPKHTACDFPHIPLLTSAFTPLKGRESGGSGDPKRKGPRPTKMRVSRSAASLGGIGEACRGAVGEEGLGPGVAARGPSGWRRRPGDKALGAREAQEFKRGTPGDG